MTNYYFVATALPPLQLGVPPEITFEEFDNLLKDNLTAEDYAKTQVVRRFYDIQNIRAFWKKEGLDPRGNLNELTLEEALLTREGFPDYVYDFLDAYETIEDKLHNFPRLVAMFFQYESEEAEGFLREYLNFEREWRLVLTGFRAKQLGRDLSAELQFEDPQDDFVAQILAQKDAKVFLPPDGYEDLQPLFEEHGASPLELYQALCEYRFYKIESLLGIDLFSIDVILGYMAQLITVEKWIELDKKKGLDIMDKVVSTQPSEKKK